MNRYSPKKPGWFRRLLSWCRRHPILTIVIIIVLCIFGAISNAAQGSNASPQTTTTQNTQANNAIDTHQALTATATSNTPYTPPTNTPTPKPQPTHQATPKPTPKPTQPTCQAVNGNPWCYNFSSGNLIYVPPSNFCDYFNCISSFWGSDDPGDGYVIQCVDGTFSQSGGERGACSSHGGELKPLYSH